MFFSSSNRKIQHYIAAKYDYQRLRSEDGWATVSLTAVTILSLLGTAYFSIGGLYGIGRLRPHSVPRYRPPALEAIRPVTLTHNV